MPISDVYLFPIDFVSIREIINSVNRFYCGSVKTSNLGLFKRLVRFNVRIEKELTSST